MVKIKFGHLSYVVAQKNIKFYEKMMEFMGCPVYHKADDSLGYGLGDDGSVWFVSPAKDVNNDYDGPGLNHLGLHTETIEDVDKMVAWLKEAGIPTLFDTPRHRPEFSQGENTYYQVMFETPDNILLEVVYMGPK